MASFVADAVTYNTTAGNKSASITPAVGDLLVVCFTESAQTTVGTITDNQGGTYTVIASVLRAASADYLAIAIRNSLVSSAVSHTVTMTAGGTNTGGGLDVMRFSGMTKTGAAAARQVASQTNQAAGGTPAPVFSSAPLTTNALVAFIANGASPAAMTPPSGFTERQDLGFSSPTRGMETATADSGITSTTITWGSSSGTAFGDIVVELDASSGTTNNDSGSGGAALSGSKTESKTVSDSGSGATTLSGTRTESKSVSDSRSGALALAGTSTESKSVSDSRTGAETLSGTRTESYSATGSGTGQETLGGTATESKSVTDSGSGAETLSGSGTESHVYTDSASGVLTLAGTDSEADSVVASGTGQVALAGTGAETHVYDDAAALALALAGTSSESASVDASGSGALVISGTGTESYGQGNVDDGTGAITLAGVSSESVSMDDALSGALVLSGFAVESLSRDESGSGVLVLAGTAVESNSSTPPPQPTPSGKQRYVLRRQFRIRELRRP